jgi:hypothetical protein
MYSVLCHTSEVVGSEWSASRTYRFTPWERDPGTYFIIRLMSHRAGLHDMEK